MPLEVARLRDSDLVALSTGDEFKAALLLWGASWGQVPAASLPCDDRILARLAGCAPAEFRRLRKMALYGFILCSDDRLYHPVLADLAMRAFAKRRGQAERANSRWAASRAENAAKSTESPMPRQSRGAAGAVQGRGEGTGPDSPEGDEGFEHAWRAYPHIRGRSSRPKALAAWARLSQAHRAALPAAIARYAREGREPKAQCGAPGMDRWLRDERFLDWLATAASAPASPRFPEPIRAAVVAAKGEDWTRSWLDPCRWTGAAIATANAFAADTLRRELAPVLAALGAGVEHAPLPRGDGASADT